MNDRRLIMLLGLILSLAWRTPVSGAQSQPPEPDWQEYRVIVERNIFLKQRGPRAEPLSASLSDLPQLAPPRPMPIYLPESSLVLTGIIRRGGEHIAFLEETRTGVTSRLGIGDPVGDGRIAHIALDRLVFERNGQSAEIEVGRCLDGTRPSRMAASALRDDAGLPALPSLPGLPSRMSPMIHVGAPEPVVGQAFAPPTASDGADRENESGVLERLRERRQKELSDQ